ncbi:MAG: hypothetical protein RLZZ361_545 [Cyanobacteriota bacterium]
MKTLYLVTSAINPTSIPFKYLAGDFVPRSVFSAKDRFNQTIYSLSHIRGFDRDANIVILDCSEDYYNYAVLQRDFENVTFIGVPELSWEVQDIANTSKQKSYAECSMLKIYMDAFRPYILEHDYFVKVSGRYTVEGINPLQYQKNRFFFKIPNSHDTSLDSQLSFVDTRTNKLDSIYSYSTVCYGMDTKLLDKYYQINDNIISVVTQEQYSHLCSEFLIYYYTRELKNSIIEYDWTVNGFDGVNGGWVRY